MCVLSAHHLSLSLCGGPESGTRDVGVFYESIWLCVGGTRVSVTMTWETGISLKIEQIHRDNIHSLLDSRAASVLVKVMEGRLDAHHLMLGLAAKQESTHRASGIARRPFFWRVVDARRPVPQG